MEYDDLKNFLYNFKESVFDQYPHIYLNVSRLAQFLSFVFL